MPGSTFGTALRLTTAGESHGPANVAILDGVPPGLELSEEDLQADLDRRRPGQSKITTQRKESDRAQILSGVFEGRTTGTAIAILVPNEDQRSRDYGNLRETYRPGHADYTYDAKYGRRDHRGGGRSSARETVVRVAAGAIAKKLLSELWGVRIVGYVKSVADVDAEIPAPEEVTLEQVESNIVRCPDPKAAERMIERIEEARRDLDSLGGVAELVASGVPPGWGEPVFDKLKSDFGRGLFSLPAVLGVEYGSGFGAARLRGSENNDVFEPAEEAVSKTGVPTAAGAAGRPPVRTATNRHGGMLGGISSGMPIVLRCAVKPTSSLAREQRTVQRDGAATTVATKGRHDPCLLPRFIPMGEAMVALVLADHGLRQLTVEAAAQRLMEKATGEE
ncbi:MAG: chorismate synthase [Acidobacteria bacterium]|nr:MAG: chorismate synthase [Acidobacteriota bacterium]REK00334.1 MAG: chorismate synthase [Acidobacteriota bacterium]